MAAVIGGLGPVAPALAIASIPDDSVCALPGVILGTEGDDTITGTSGDDVICGLGGNDKINGLGGNDIIIGGSGDDTISGGEGNDTISGEIGDDYIDGQSGQDSIYGGDGADSLLGGPDDDYVAGGVGADNLFGNDGSDQLLGGAGNDSLNGGAAADLLNGESGVNTCQKQPIDRVVSCYYDKKGPQLLNLAIDPADQSLDSTDPNRKLHIRYTISDPGTGVQYAQINFADAKFYAKARKSSVLTTYPSDSFAANLYSGASAPRCSDNSSAPTCLLSGTATLGVYQSTIALPRNLQTLRYYAFWFSATDAVGNETNLYPKSMSQKRLAVSFSQTGVNDRIGPSVTAIRILGGRTLATKSSSVVAEVAYVDPGAHGLGNLQLDYGVLGNKFGQEVTLQFRAGYYGAAQYLDLPNMPSGCPDDISQIATGCLVSGDQGSGIARLRMTVSGYSSGGSARILKGLLRVKRATSTDSFGNSRTYKKLSKNVLAASVLHESFGYSPDKDHTPPALISASASTSHIDTGAADQTVIYRFVAKDNGAGVSVDPFDSTITIMRNGLECGDGTNNCGRSVDVCKQSEARALSKSTVSFVYTCVFPAHMASGNYSLHIQATDKSANGNISWFEDDALRKAGLSPTLVNG